MPWARSRARNRWAMGGASLCHCVIPPHVIVIPLHVLTHSIRLIPFHITRPHSAPFCRQAQHWNWELQQQIDTLVKEKKALPARHDVLPFIAFQLIPSSHLTHIRSCLSHRLSLYIYRIISMYK